MALEVATGTPMANMAETSRKRRKRGKRLPTSYCTAVHHRSRFLQTLHMCLYRLGRPPGGPVVRHGAVEHARPEASRFGESHSVVAGGVHEDQRARRVASGASVCGGRLVWGPNERPRVGMRGRWVVGGGAFCVYCIFLGRAVGPLSRRT